MVFVSVKDGSSPRTNTLTEPQEPMQPCSETNMML
jgi:hypothetical protein